ncbi:hypothetical protein [Terriglobus roseus]|nr:hypothetical protein [Terriglobus roseus]
MENKSIRNFSTSVRWASLCAICFWTPDILIHLIKTDSSHQAWLVTAVCPVVFLLSYIGLIFFSRKQINARHAFFVMVGIWCSGGIATMIAASSGGGGFVSSYKIAMGISLLGVVFPPFTLFFTTYDGSLFALSVVSILLILDAASGAAEYMRSLFHPATA